MDFWNDMIEDACLECATMRELALVAKDALSIVRQKMRNAPIAMISGPITSGGLGTEVLNVAVHGECVRIAREHKVVAFDQIRFQPHMDRIVGDAGTDAARRMRDEFYNSVMGSGSISLLLSLPTWQTSRGATWCRWKAYYMGTIAIQDYPPEWYARALAAVSAPKVA